jgi:hypothetical protein
MENAKRDAIEAVQSFLAFLMDPNQMLVVRIAFGAAALGFVALFVFTLIGLPAHVRDNIREIRGDSKQLAADFKELGADPATTKKYYDEARARGLGRAEALSKASRLFAAAQKA